MSRTLLRLVLARLVFRRMWIGDTVFILLLSAAQIQAYTYPRQTVILETWEMLTVVAYTWMFRRCGLLSFGVFLSVYSIVRLPPVDGSTWYMGRALGAVHAPNDSGLGALYDSAGPKVGFKIGIDSMIARPGHQVIPSFRISHPIAVRRRIPPNQAN